MSDTLSKTMLDAVTFTRKHGGIERYPGGFWQEPGLPMRAAKYYGTQTIDALVRRNLLKYTKWKDGRNSSFPVKAEFEYGRILPLDTIHAIVQTGDTIYPVEDGAFILENTNI